MITPLDRVIVLPRRGCGRSGGGQRCGGVQGAAFHLVHRRRGWGAGDGGLGLRGRLPIRCGRRRRRIVVFRPFRQMEEFELALVAGQFKGPRLAVLTQAIQVQSLEQAGLLERLGDFLLQLGFRRRRRPGIRRRHLGCLDGGRRDAGCGKGRRAGNRGLRLGQIGRKNRQDPSRAQCRHGGQSACSRPDQSVPARGVIKHAAILKSTTQLK